MSAGATLSEIASKSFENGIHGELGALEVLDPTLAPFSKDIGDAFPL